MSESAAHLLPTLGIYLVEALLDDGVHFSFLEDVLADCSLLTALLDVSLADIAVQLDHVAYCRCCEGEALLLSHRFDVVVHLEAVVLALRIIQSGDAVDHADVPLKQVFSE